MAHLRALAVALAMLLLAAAPAAAASRTVTSFVPSSGEGSGQPSYSAYTGPYLAGGSVAWTRSVHAGGWVVERGAPGRRPTRMATVPRPAADAHYVRLRGASATRTAFSEYAFDVVNAHDGRTSTLINTMTASTLQPGSAQALAGCGGAFPPCTCREYCYPDELYGDLDGDTLAYVEGRYGDAVIVVDDLASSAGPIRIDRDAAISNLRVAGDLLAWAELGGEPSYRTVVYDWRAGRELYSVADTAPYALQPDGKFATLGSDGRVTWYSPAEPTAHRIESPAGRPVTALAMARDRLLLSVTGDATTRLMLADLSGAATEVAARPCCGFDAPFGNFDFDGSRAAWADYECGLVSIVLHTDVVRTAPRSGTKPCTPPELSDLRFAAGGRVAARVLCEKGCRGTLSLYENERSRRGRLARRAVDLRPGRRPRSLRFEPSARDRARIAKLPRLRVQVVFSGRDGRGHRVAETRTGSLKRP